MNKGFLNPQKLIQEIGFKYGDKVADFGSGSGNLTVFIAQAVGNSGRVFAIDVQERALQAVKSRAEIMGLNNIKTIQADLEAFDGSTLKENSMDAVFVSNTLFQVKDKEAVIKEAKRVLRDSGMLIIVDWQPKQTPFGPHSDRRTSPEEVKKIVGKESERELTEVGDFYFGLVFIK